MTAESISELLHRPLYSVTVGELGTDVGKLEAKLTIILDIAACWNAVILIDEADIFLEARDNQNIERNAMVGVFLRLLEYHSGVLFLTTNRLQCFDEAFHSRINVTLRFDNLNQESKTKIWKNMIDNLFKSSMFDINIEELARIQLNGRQIRNCLQMAKTYAEDKKVQVNTEIIMKSLTFIGIPQ